MRCRSHLEPDNPTFGRMQKKELKAQYPFLYCSTILQACSLVSTMDNHDYKARMFSCYGSKFVVSTSNYALEVLRGSVVPCTTRDLENPGLSHTGSFGFFHGSVLGQGTSKLQPSTVKTQEIHECEKCRHDMLKAASKKRSFINQS